MSKPNVCDITQLEAMTGGDADVMKQFMQMYLADTPVLFQKLMDANQRNFYTGTDSVQFCAHKIAPQLGYMGNTIGYDLAKKIENDMIAGNQQTVDADVNSLKENIEQSYVELNEFLKKS